MTLTNIHLALFLALGMLGGPALAQGLANPDRPLFLPGEQIDAPNRAMVAGVVEDWQDAAWLHLDLDAFESRRSGDLDGFNVSIPVPTRSKPQRIRV